MLACLQKAGKTASGVVDPAIQTSLLVEILNQYIFFYEKGMEAVRAFFSFIRLVLTIHRVISAAHDAHVQDCRADSAEPVENGRERGDHTAQDTLQQHAQAR